jgi:hypothetical protein
LKNGSAPEAAAHGGGASLRVQSPLTSGARTSTLDLVSDDFELQTADGSDVGVHHAAERWARTVLAVRMAHEDPRTIAEWGRFLGVSSGTLRAWCYMAGVSPRMSLCLARTLRAALLAPKAQCDPGDLLDVRDPRTLKRLLRSAGLLDGRIAASPDIVGSLCERQQFVRKTPLLRVIRRLSRASPGEPARQGSGI